MSDLKRKLVKKIIKSLRLFWPLRQKKTHIVFEACEKFHYMHIETIVQKINQDKRFKITIVKWSNFDAKDEIPDIKYKTFDEFWHDWFNIYDILVTTELDRKPSWFDGVAIGISHGAGPKMSYIKDPVINNYDVIFSVGPTTYEVQKKFVDKSVTIEKIGLPITDKLVSNNKHQLPSLLQFPSIKPVILYAPSWSVKKNLISMDQEILTALDNLLDYNVIIRPHPNLLDPDKCHGIDWQKNIDKLNNPQIKISYSKDHSVYELLQHIDVLVGDISSVTYEYLIMNRPIILYMKDHVLKDYDANDFIEPLLRATTKLESADSLDSTLRSINNQNLSDARKKLLTETLFNVGEATDHAISAITKHSTL